MNIWKNLTPLDSSQFEVFLGFFWNFFIFLNLNLNLEFGPVWYQPKPEPGQTGLTGNRSNRTGSHRLGEPCTRPHRDAQLCMSVVSIQTMKHSRFQVVKIKETSPLHVKKKHYRVHFTVTSINSKFSDTDNKTKSNDSQSSFSKKKRKWILFYVNRMYLIW